MVPSPILRRRRVGCAARRRAGRSAVAPVPTAPAVPTGGALTSLPRTAVPFGPSGAFAPLTSLAPLGALGPSEAVVAVVLPEGSAIGELVPAVEEPVASASRRGSPTLRLAGLVTGMVAVAFAALALAITGPTSEPLLHVPWLVLLVAFIVGDRIDVNIDIRDGSLSMTLSHLVLVVGLFGMAPGTFVAARAIGGGLSLLLLPDDRNWSKSIFNNALFLLEGALAVATFRAVAGGYGSPLEWRGWVAALFAIAVCTVADAWLIVSAIRIAQPDGEHTSTCSAWSAWRSVARPSTPPSGSSPPSSRSPCLGPVPPAAPGRPLPHRLPRPRDVGPSPRAAAAHVGLHPRPGAGDRPRRGHRHRPRRSDRGAAGGDGRAAVLRRRRQRPRRLLGGRRGRHRGHRIRRAGEIWNAYSSLQTARHDRRSFRRYVRS